MSDARAHPSHSLEFRGTVCKAPLDKNTSARQQASRSRGRNRKGQFRRGTVRATEFPVRDQRGEPRTSALTRERPLYYTECAPSYQEVLARNSGCAGLECAFNKRQRFRLFIRSAGAKRASEKRSDGMQITSFS